MGDVFVCLLNLQSRRNKVNYCRFESRTSRLTSSSTMTATKDHQVDERRDKGEDAQVIRRYLQPLAFIIEQKARQRLGNLRLGHSGGAKEEEGRDGAGLEGFWSPARDVRTASEMTDTM